MAARAPSSDVDRHFAGRAPSVRATYAALLKAAKTLGPFEEDPKKTSIHLNRKTAFAGVATRKDALILTLKSDRELEGPLVVKREQTSRNRWHVEVRLRSPADVDARIRRWLAAAYALSG